MRIEFEFTDGSCMAINDVVPGDEWDEVMSIESKGVEILSAWRDDEPWFGLCTDMREGQP